MSAAAGVRVMICDDSPAMRVLVRHTLQLSGRLEVVAEATDGVEAVELVREHRPDVLLLDLSMPRLDGLEALPLIREESPATRIVVFSGFGEDVMAEQALELGADAYLQKGADPDTLIAAVEALAPA